MNVHALIYTPAAFPDELYERALAALDAASQARIRRFYHRADACRTLLGRLLVRVMLLRHGVPPAAALRTTPAGKPYLESAAGHPPLAFNVTHDNALVALAAAPGVHAPPAFRLGVDVMKLRVPGRDRLRAFIATVGEQLTPREHAQLTGAEALGEAAVLSRFFWMWTLKEAYTKALGLGLGFDFSRVEFDVLARVVRVDGRVPPGWAFRMFEVVDGEDRYQGVVAEYTGGAETSVVQDVAPAWLTVQDAASFAEEALAALAGNVAA